jgi:hypothetical protein
VKRLEMRGGMPPLRHMPSMLGTYLSTETTLATLCLLSGGRVAVSVHPPLWPSGKSLERGPLSFVSTIEDLTGRKNSCSGLIWPQGSVTMTTWHPLSAKVGTNLTDKRRSLADSGHGCSMFVFGTCPVQISAVYGVG